MSRSPSTASRNGKPNSAPRLLVVGAGVAGQSLVQEIRAKDYPVQPVAFLDDDPKLIGTRVCELEVHGGTENLVEVAAAVRAQEVLLAIPSGGGSLVRRLVILCKRAGLPFRLVPGVRDIILGDVRFDQVSQVQPEHLLGRESVDFNDAAARNLVQGQTVMVTGAGGSIGSELCRRLVDLNPARLILLGRGENSIFEVAAELQSRNPDVKLEQVIADVRDRRRLEVLGGRLSPDFILHAAAHKHVPLMENNPEEAILVNIGGTANLVEFARRVGARRFVLISTDKAVAPTSIMGATKKVAEMVVRRAAANGADTRFMTVRFGNVLGSRGSVVPFFQKRIEAGLPLPITHPDMTRYFMTIKEAAMLVVEAMVMGEQGSTYILEMGNPVSILELARNLLALSGYDPAGGDDGPGIQITGLRPGERLHERLHEEYETLETSEHPLISKADSLNGTSDRVMGVVDRLQELARDGDVPALRDLIAGLLSRPELAAKETGQ